MIDLDAARSLKRAVAIGVDSGDIRGAALGLLDSIEKEYGDLEKQVGLQDPQTIRDWQGVIHQYAQDKGWWDRDDRTFGDFCALFTSEVSEAYEEWRNGHDVTETYFNESKPDKPEGVPTELADVVIRILDYCGRVGIDMQSIMAQKHAFNLQRPYRHGNKRV